MSARSNLTDLIEGQEHREVRLALTGSVQFYERSAERFLHVFSQKTEANIAEACIAHDNKLQGPHHSLAEFLHWETVGYMHQDAKLSHSGKGGYERRPAPRTGTKYSQRREEAQSALRGQQCAEDVMEEFAATYTPDVVVLSDTRDHRPNTGGRRFPAKRKSAASSKYDTEDDSRAPAIVRVQKAAAGGYEWQLDTDVNQRHGGERKWLSSAAVKKDAEYRTYLQSFLTAVSVHSGDRDGGRFGVLDGYAVRYLVNTTKEQLKMWLQLFLGDGNMKVIHVGAVTPFLDAKMRPVSVLAREFKVSCGNGHVFEVTFGHIHGSVAGEEQSLINCTCQAWQGQKQRTARSTSIHWCRHMVFILLEAGYLPGNFIFYQAGLTVEEVSDALKNMTVIEATPITEPIKLNEWIVLKGQPDVKRQAKCSAAMNNRHGCATEKASNGLLNQPFWLLAVLV